MKKTDSLDSDIRKLMKSIHGEEIDEKIEAKMAELRGELESRSSPAADLAPLMAAVRENKERQQRLESGLNRLENIIRKTEGTDCDKLWSTLQNEIEKLSSDLKEQAAKDRDRIEDMQNQLSGIKDMFKELHGIQESLRGFDARSMAREIEALKQKVSWLQENQVPANVDELKERIEDIEAQLRSRSDSPLIIE